MSDFFLRHFPPKITIVKFANLPSTNRVSRVIVPRVFRALPGWPTGRLTGTRGALAHAAAHPRVPLPCLYLFLFIPLYLLFALFSDALSLSLLPVDPDSLFPFPAIPARPFPSDDMDLAHGGLPSSDGASSAQPQSTLAPSLKKPRGDAVPSGVMHVRNLPMDCTEHELRAVIPPQYPVVKVFIVIVRRVVGVWVTGEGEGRGGEWGCRHRDVNRHV